LRLILKAEEKLEKKKLPVVIKSTIKNIFNKISDDIDSYKNPIGSYLFPDDGFQKDLGICRLNLIPARHSLLEITKLTKRFLLRGGVKEIVERVLFLVFELGGFQPFLQAHIDARPGAISLSNFNPNGWKQLFLMTAEILKLNPQIRGYYRI